MAASNATPAASSDRVLLHMAEAYAIEQAIIALLVKPITGQLNRIRQAVLHDWARKFHTLRGVQDDAKFNSVVQAMSQELDKLHLDPQHSIIDAAHKGLDIGVKQTLDEANRTRKSIPVRLDSGVYSYASGVAQDVRRKLESARALARNMRKGTLIQTTRSLDVVTHAIHTAEQAVTTVFHEHRNIAAQAVIEDLGVLKMWFAEPDACKLCLPLHGTVVPAGGTFPAVLTHGSRLIDWVDTNAGLAGPPLHPRCRCQLVPYEPN